MGKVYVQVVIDVLCSFAFAKVYLHKTPVGACDLLYDRVLPFYEAIEVAEIQRALDTFLAYYNHERTHQGYRLQGRTPAAALKEALGLAVLPEVGSRGGAGRRTAHAGGVDCREGPGVGQLLNLYILAAMSYVGPTAASAPYAGSILACLG